MNARNSGVGCQEALVHQYRLLIRDALTENEHEHKTSTGAHIGKLNSKLRVICKAAEYDGLPEEAISQLIDEVIPL